MTSYATALDAVVSKAVQLQSTLADAIETLPPSDAIGRLASCNHYSPCSTPRFTSSAMDGFAVHAADTKGARDDNPVEMLVLHGVCAAGRPEMRVKDRLRCNGMPLCVEIMTGARFPVAVQGEDFDAVVKIEDADMQEILDQEQEPKDAMTPAKSRRVLIRREAESGQHRRCAGEDYQREDILLHSGEIVTERHVMAFASVRIDRITVRRRLKIGIISTGLELQKEQQSTGTGDASLPDVNGPYLKAVLRERGAEAHFLGILNDSVDDVISGINAALSQQQYDLLISTGGVSVGTFDCVAKAVRRMCGDIVFHGVAMRPGHPVLFATLLTNVNNQRQEVPFFGLPGNPIATAVCLETLVMPFLEYFAVRRPGVPCRARFKRGESEQPDAVRCVSIDEFRHGILATTADECVCSLSDEQSPAKIRPFVRANCLVHLKPGGTQKWDDMVVCLPL